MTTTYDYAEATKQDIYDFIYPYLSESKTADIDSVVLKMLEKLDKGFPMYLKNRYREDDADTLNERIKANWGLVDKYILNPEAKNDAVDFKSLSAIDYKIRYSVFLEMCKNEGIARIKMEILPVVPEITEIVQKVLADCSE